MMPIVVPMIDVMVVFPGAEVPEGIAVPGAMRTQTLGPVLTAVARLADDTLRKLEHAIEQADGDFDYELSEGGILEIEIANASVIVVNKQAAAQEIWVAAKSGGFHFRWDGSVWRDTRSNEELFSALSRFSTEQSGVVVKLQ